MSDTMDWQRFFRPGTPVLALPNWRRPRLFVPADTAARRWALSEFYPAYRFSARAWRWILQSLAMAGVGQTRIASGDSWALGDFLGRRFSQDVWPAVAIGTRGAAQKITVRLANAIGATVGYIKCADTPAARSRLEREHQILRWLPDGVGPRLLALGQLGDAAAMLLRPAPGRLFACAARPDADVAAFLNQLNHGDAAVSADAHPGLDFLRDHNAAADGTDSWIDALSNRSWPIAIQHGDFAPWNVYHRLQPEGSTQLTAIDWEYARLDGFPHLDLAYWSLQVSALIYRASPARARAAAVRSLMRNASPDLSESECHAIVSATALSAYRDALADGDLPTEPIQQWQRDVWRLHPRPATIARGSPINPSEDSIAAGAPVAVG
jgi:hypothetical protein